MKGLDLRSGIKFTGPELKEIRNAAVAVWNHIGADCGDDVHGDDMIELISDASRLEVELDLMMRRALKDGIDTPITKDMIDRVEKLTFAEAIKVLKPAFWYD